MNKTDDYKKKKNDDNRQEIHRDIKRVGVAMAGSETVARYGSANAEFVKGYNGVDNQTGQKFAKGLKKISNYKVNENPAEAIKNIKQQSGYSAEVAATSRDNADAIIKGSPIRTSRSDDRSEYSRNHTTVDRVQVLNGKVIEGSEAQMKFVGDRDKLFRDITKEKGKFARYRGLKLELPSEQFEGAKEYCLEEAKKLRDQALSAEAKGSSEAAKALRKQADNYEQLAENVRDSGLTTDKAISYRKNPKLETAKDIVRTSHGAAMETMKYGTAIGASISILHNSINYIQGKQSIGDAATTVMTDTVKVAGFSYATGFAGAAVKGTLEQSTNSAFRTLASTNAPVLAVNVCISLSGSVKRYVSGEMSESEFLSEVGEKGAGMLSGAMMAGLGQIAIPIPVVGAVIGSMIGYTMSSLFYQSALEASRGAEQSAIMLERTKEIQRVAREQIAFEQVQLDKFISTELPDLRKYTLELDMLLSSNAEIDVNDIAVAINGFAELLGKKLQFSNTRDFEEFMLGSEALKF